MLKLYNSQKLVFNEIVCVLVFGVSGRVRWPSSQKDFMDFGSTAVTQILLLCGAFKFVRMFNKNYVFFK